MDTTSSGLVARAVRRAIALRNAPFLRAVGILVAGTALSQLISLAITPVLTRLYTPADFDTLSVFVGVTIISSLGACLGFDFALPVARSDRDAVNLLGCALLGVAASTMIIVLLAAAVLNSGVLAAAKTDELRLLLWLAPGSTMLIGASNAFEYWATRHKRFRTISLSRIIQVVVGGGLQISGGLAGLGPIALLVGYALVNGLAIVTLAASFVRNDRLSLAAVRWSELRRVAREYNQFLRYTSVEAVANACSVYLPLIIISIALTGAEAGYLFLAIRLLQAPLQLVGRSVSQVYQSRLPDLVREGALSEQTLRVFRTLLGVAVPPVAGLALVAPDLAQFALGSDYRPVGGYIGLIAPWVLLHFATAAILPTMYALGRNAQIMIVTLGGLAFRVAVVTCAAIWAPTLAPAAYAGSGAIFYGVCAVIFLRVNAIGLDCLVRRTTLFWLVLAVVIGLATMLRWSAA